MQQLINIYLQKKLADLVDIKACCQLFMVQAMRYQRTVHTKSVYIYSHVYNPEPPPPPPEKKTTTIN